MTDIRPATADDLPRIEQIYDAIHTAEETGAASVGWARGIYPTRATAQAALDDGALFVLEDDGVLVAAGRIDRTHRPDAGAGLCAGAVAIRCAAGAGARAAHARR